MFTIAIIPTTTIAEDVKPVAIDIGAAAPFAGVLTTEHEWREIKDDLMDYEFMRDRIKKGGQPYVTQETYYGWIFLTGLIAGAGTVLYFDRH